MVVLPHFVTDLSAQSPKPNARGNVNLPLNAADSIFNANTSIALGTKNISSTPFRVEESHFSDHGFLKDVGNVTWKQTFKSTYLINCLKAKVMEHSRRQMGIVLLGYHLT